MRSIGARGHRDCCILRPLFVAAAVVWRVSYVGRYSGHIMCCVLHRVEWMQRVAFSVACLYWYVASLCHTACRAASGNARRCMLHVASVASTLLHSECCTLHRACGMLFASPSSDAPPSVAGHRWWFQQRWGAKHVRRQRDVRVCGDLLYPSIGARGREGPIGSEAALGGVSRKAAWCTRLAGQSRSRAAASNALRRCAILVADHCVGCVVRGIVCGVCCNLCLMLHGVRPCCLLVLDVVFCRLPETCLRGQWDGPCCTRMLCVALHVACLYRMVYVVVDPLRFECCML
jgi:hypothetical protein